METELAFKLSNGREVEIVVDLMADACPQCHYAIDPRIILGVPMYGESKGYEVVCQCPRADCGELFILYYDERYGPDGVYLFRQFAPISPLDRTFSPDISEVSPKFPSIFNQAQYAESLGLHDICGPGYRKALEFLAKDFACRQHPDQKDEIESAFLRTVIEKHVEDPRVKKAATLASWLGNDETHYVRRWEGMNLNDLKALIELTVRHVESTLILEKYERDMNP